MRLTIRSKVVPLCMRCISFCSESSHNTAKAIENCALSKSTNPYFSIVLPDFYAFYTYWNISTFEAIVTVIPKQYHPNACHTTQSITIHLIAPKEGGSKGDSPDAMKYEFPTWASVFVVSWFNKSNHRVSVSLCLIIQFTLTSVAMFDLKYLAINLPGYVIWRHQFFQSKPRCATK